MIDVLSQILNVLLLVIALALIGIVVIQRNEGGLGGLGGGTGGGMGGLMTGRAAANLLTKITRWLAVAFFSVTLALAYIASQRAAPPSLTQTPPTQQQEAPVESGSTAPATEGSAPAGSTSGTAGGATEGSGGAAGSPPTAPTSNQ
jgi:preprotein translocase subunit SecG